MKILVIDDESIFLEYLRLSLKNYGYDADCTTNPINALSIYKNEKYDVVITDLNMPYMTGLELTGIIHSIDQKAVIIVISADDENEVICELLNKGAYAFLSKPVRFSILIEMLKKIEKKIGLRI